MPVYITHDRLIWLYAGLFLLIVLAVVGRSLLHKDGRARDVQLFVETPSTFVYGVVGIALAICFLLWVLGVGAPLGAWAVIALIVWGAAGIVGHDLSLRRERHRRTRK